MVVLVVLVVLVVVVVVLGPPWAHVFFFPFHKPNYYECAFFLAKPTTHARVVRHTILKRNGKKKP